MIPKAIEDSWNRVNKRIDEFCEGDAEHSFRMLFITDVHIGAENKNNIKQLHYVGELIKRNKIDLVVNGGDIGLDVGEDEVEARRVIDVTDLATQYQIPYFFIKGNHDKKKGVITGHELNKRLNKCFLGIDKSKGEVVVDEVFGGGYGTYVDKISDTRLLFLNTSENASDYDVTQKQLRYVVNVLENMKERNLIIISHYCINECGAWVEYPPHYSKEMSTLRQIEKDFANRGKGGNDILDWNFEKTNSNLVLHLCGDSHFNNQSTSDGYLIACRQGYGGVDPINIAEGGSFDRFDKDNNCNFDILVINSKQKKRLFRIGAGEISRDIVF